MLLVHGFQAGEIRAHVGSAPFNREGGETQNPYQDGRANCVTTNGQMASGKSRDFRPWESRPFPANSGMGLFYCRELLKSPFFIPLNRSFS